MSYTCIRLKLRSVRTYAEDGLEAGTVVVPLQHERRQTLVHVFDRSCERGVVLRERLQQTLK